MKKLILFLLLFTTYLQAQTLPNVKNNSTETNTLKIKSNIQDNSATKIPVQSSDGSINWVNKSDLITQTTAGTFARVNFTGDVSVVNSVNYYATSTTNKGSVASVAQTVSPDDNQKLYFAQDYISILQPNLVIYPPGNYSGQFAVQVANNSVQQKFYIEVYKTNSLGVPIASGVSGAAVGSLGVTLITTMESGLVSLTGSTLTNITLTGNLTGTLTVNANERIKYHIAAEKVGTAGGTISMQIFSGTNYNSYYDVPVPVNTDVVINKSTIQGNALTDVLNNIPVKVAPLFSTSTVNPIYYGNSPNLDRSSTFYINKPTSVTNDGWHSISSYSSITLSGATAAHAVFDGRDEITANTNIDHIVGGMQARSILLGSGNVANFDGTRSVVVHNGTGVVAKSSAYKAYTPQGTGAITEIIGYETEDFGTNKAFYARGGLSIFMGNTGIGTISPGAKLHTVGGVTMTGGYIRNTLKEASFPVDVFYSTATSRYGGISYDGSAGFEFFINSLTSDISTVSSKVRFTNTGTVVASPATLSTELVTKSQLDSAVRPYKVYTALLTQTGTSAPTVTVIENTLGGTVVWAYDVVGQYSANLTGAFIGSKTVAFTMMGSSSGADTLNFNYGNSTVNQMSLVHKNSSGINVDGISKASIEIRVYN